MGIPPSEAGRLSLWQYTALVHHWNERHGDGKGAPVTPPDRETFRRARAALTDKRFLH